MCLMLLLLENGPRLSRNLIVYFVYVEEIPLVTNKSSRSGILFPSVGQYVGVPVDRKEYFFS